MTVVLTIVVALILMLLGAPLWVVFVMGGVIGVGNAVIKSNRAKHAK